MKLTSFPKTTIFVKKTLMQNIRSDMDSKQNTHQNVDNNLLSNYQNISKTHLPNYNLQRTLHAQNDTKIQG